MNLLDLFKDSSSRTSSPISSGHDLGPNFYERNYDGSMRREFMTAPLFLNSLVLFPPDDTASNLNPGARKAAGFPQYGHGSIKLGALFNDPSDPE